MIFSHTLGLVLSSRKTATTRVWKDNYYAVLDVINECNDDRYKQIYYVGSRKTNRKLYYIGQLHSVQPGRGKMGVGVIEITRLSRVMIHNVVDDPDFVYREGFKNKAEFLKVWRSMHDDKQMALHIRFKCVSLLD